MCMKHMGDVLFWKMLWLEVLKHEMLTQRWIYIHHYICLGSFQVMVEWILKAALSIWMKEQKDSKTSSNCCLSLALANTLFFFFQLETENFPMLSFVQYKTIFETLAIQESSLLPLGICPWTSREEEQPDGPGDPVLLNTPPDSYGKPPKVNLMLSSCLSAACTSSLPE